MISCTGSILHVDLTTAVIEKRSVPDDVYAKVLAGKGLGVWYLMKYLPPDADPLGPDNILGFTTGALTGTGALMCGRWTVVCKSPLTGGWGDASCGGDFAAAIKQCGFDAIFFSGISDHPVYFYADNKTVELRDARPYWGMSAGDAEDKLIADNWIKKKPSVALIGQAGETVSLISGICNEDGRIAARSGVGAVMGSKMLKALVLAGSKPMPGNKPKTHEVAKVMGRKLKKTDVPKFVKGGTIGLLGKGMGALPATVPMDGSMLAPLFKRWGTTLNTTLAITSGDGPIKNWGGTPKDVPGSVKAFNPDRIAKREIHKYHCYSCALGCGGTLDIEDIKNGEFKEVHKPEYETLQAFGPLVLNNDLDSILYINKLLNRAGMDSISAGTTVAYAVECFENGIITEEDTGGLKLSWGNAEAIIELIKQMIAREGIGALFADGVKMAHKRLDGQGKQFAIHVGGQEPGMHDSRNDPQLAVHFVADPSPGKHTLGMTQMYGSMSLCDICSWAPNLGVNSKKDDLEPSEKGALRSVANSCYSMLTDAVGGCYYAEMMGVHIWNPVAFMNAANDLDESGDHYMEIGKRIQTLRQMFNTKHHFDPTKVKLPDRMQGKPPLDSGPLKGVTLNIDETVALHWKTFGWDEHSGVPLDSTVEELGITELLALEDTPVPTKSKAVKAADNTDAKTEAAEANAAVADSSSTPEQPSCKAGGESGGKA